MKKHMFLIIYGLVTTSPGVFAETLTAVDIPEGDTAALIEAVAQANDAPVGTTTQIQLTGTYLFTNNASLPSVTGRITLSGIANGHTRIAGTGRGKKTIN